MGKFIESSEIIKLYLDGKTINDIRSITGRDRSAISRAIRRAGIAILNPNGSRISKLDDPRVREEVIKRYTEGLSVAEIKRIYRVAPRKVRAVLATAGVAIRSYSDAFIARAATYRMDAFDDAENGEIAAYWIGMLMADGCVGDSSGISGSPRITLALKAADAEHLKSFARFVETEKSTSSAVGVFKTLSK